MFLKRIRQLHAFAATDSTGRAEHFLSRITATAVLCAFPVFSRTIVVDQSHPSASNTAQGTEDSPFLTINAAAQTANPGDVVLVKTGTYRERVDPPRGGSSSDNRITYRAEERRTVIVTGLDIWETTWTKLEGDVYYAWPSDAMFQSDPGYVDGGNPFVIALRYENEMCLGQVVVDGEMYEEYVELQPVKDNAKSWWCDRTARRIYVHFPGTEPSEHVVEITTRRGVFRPHRRVGVDYLTLDGFVFEYCGNQYTGEFWTGDIQRTSGMVSTRNSNGWIIENCTVRRAKQIGLALGMDPFNADNEVPPATNGAPVRDHLVRNNCFIENGSMGLWGQAGTNNRVVSNFFYGNNTTHRPVDECGAIKIHNQTDFYVANNVFMNNHCMGVWLDAGWSNNRITRNLFIGNEILGVMFELGGDQRSLCDNNCILLGVPGGYSPSGWEGPAIGWDGQMTTQAKGVYGHGWNGSTTVHNLIFACQDWGVMFQSRSGAGTANARVLNNLLVDNFGGICMPWEYNGQPANMSHDYNMFWPDNCPLGISTLSSYGVDRVAVRNAIRQKWISVGSPGPDIDESPWIEDGWNFGYLVTLEQMQKIRGMETHGAYAPITTYEYNEGAYDFSIDISDMGSWVRGNKIDDRLTEDYFGNPIPANPLAGPFQDLSDGVNSFSLWRDDFISLEDIPDDVAIEANLPLPKSVRARALASPLRLFTSPVSQRRITVPADARVVTVFNLKGQELFSHSRAAAGQEQEIALPAAAAGPVIVKFAK